MKNLQLIVCVDVKSKVSVKETEKLLNKLLKLKIRNGQELYSVNELDPEVKAVVKKISVIPSANGGFK